MLDVAVALELIHSATLLHDDIIDGGKTRRGRASAFSRYGLANTLVTGDFLSARRSSCAGGSRRRSYLGGRRMHQPGAPRAR